MNDKIKSLEEKISKIMDGEETSDCIFALTIVITVIIKTCCPKEAWLQNAQEVAKVIEDGLKEIDLEENPSVH